MKKKEILLADDNYQIFLQEIKEQIQNTRIRVYMEYSNYPNLRQLVAEIYWGQQ